MSLSLVAIVGRPNVGKSTLFNRILRKRKAIVDAESGVTRDRHYEQTDWNGREFTLVDTGGYLAHFKDDIDKGIRFQVDEAIEEADVVLLTVDVRTGIINEDKLMADSLLKSGKPILVVANKADSAHMEADAGEFIRLGLGEPSIISALHGRKVGDLLDRIVSSLPEFDGTYKDLDSISVAIVGKPNVGKSSLVNAFLGKEKMLVTDIPGTTRDSVDSYFKWNDRVYRLIDTAGLRKKRKVYENIEYYSTIRSKRSIEECHVVVIVIDAQDGIQYQDLKIIDMAVKAKRGIVIALNKWDLISKDTHTYKKLVNGIKEKLGIHSFVEVVSISAITKQRIFKLLDVCKLVHDEWGRRIETAKLNDLLQGIVKRYYPPAYCGKQVTIKYCSQTKTSPPEFTFFTNHPLGIPESYRRYIINKVREAYGFEGVPLTVQIKKK